MRRIVIDEARWVISRGYRKQVMAETAVLACPGAFVQLVVIEPGETIPDHVHRTSREYYTALQGHCRLVVNKESIFLGPGDMLLLEPGDVHSLHNNSEEPFRLLVFKTNANSHDTFWNSENESQG